MVSICDPCQRLAKSNIQENVAVLAIKNWGNQYGYPYKVISDTGPAFREDFIRQLLTFNIKHKPSSAYHPQSNSLAEKVVQSVKNGLKKSSVSLTRQHLDEITFAINNM